jgi:hypothetical protein
MLNPEIPCTGFPYFCVECSICDCPNERWLCVRFTYPGVCEHKKTCMCWSENKPTHFWEEVAEWLTARERGEAGWKKYHEKIKKAKAWNPCLYEIDKDSQNVTKS